MASVPFVLSALQFLAATVVTKLVMLTQKQVAVPRRRGEVAAVVKVSVAYALGFALTNVAFSLAPASNRRSRFRILRWCLRVVETGVEAL